MKRRLLNLLTIASSVLFVATIGLWIRSHFVGDLLTWERDGSAGRRTLSEQWRLFSGNGVLSLAREKEWRFPEGPGYVSGTPVGDVGPPVLGPPDVAPGEFRFEWWRGNARAFVMLKAPLGFQLQNFAFESPSVGQGGSIRKMQAPHWALAAAAGLLPAARLARRLLDRWKRRAARGLCPACGYDQRASRDRCPECGTMTATLPTV